MGNLAIPCKFGSYNLIALTKIQQDDLRSFLGVDPGVYITSAPTPEWHTRYNMPLKWSYGIHKKSKMFSMMGPGSLWISRTPEVSPHQKTTRWFDGRILHMEYSSGFGRLAQLHQTLRIFGYLFLQRSKYSYCFLYNFDLPFYIVGLLLKLLLGKKIVVDFEDDYTSVRKSVIKNLINRFLFFTPDKVVCINKHMLHYFPKKETCVFNAFADLGYIKNPIRSIKPGTTFLLSSTLDDIRGADLLPELIALLDNTIISYHLHITGSGPLAKDIQSYTNEKVHFHGFLNESEYSVLLQSIDIFLVLQKPDHPFSKGSFPSKIDTYAQYHKPILVLSDDTD